MAPRSAGASSLQPSMLVMSPHSTWKPGGALAGPARCGHRFDPAHRLREPCLRKHAGRRGRRRGRRRRSGVRDPRLSGWAKRHRLCARPGDRRSCLAVSDGRRGILGSARDQQRRRNLVPAGDRSGARRRLLRHRESRSISRDRRLAERIQSARA
jgi:hypothetical protein